MNAPTLLVGLGGTGCKIINKVSGLVTEEQRKNIAFAMFDTDINELNEIKRKNPFVKTIQTSTKQTSILIRQTEPCMKTTRVFIAISEVKL